MQRVRSLLLAAGLISLMPSSSVFAQQAGQPLKIGILSDLSSVYSDIGGSGNVEATKMAIEEFGGSMFGAPIELLTADPQNKPDTAASIVRKWYENDGVDMIVDMPTSATALAGMELSKQFEKIMIARMPRARTSLGNHAHPSRHTGPMTPMRMPTRWAAPSSRTVGIPGFSSRRTMCSVIRSSATRERWSKRPAARCSAALNIHSIRRISPPIFSRPNPRRPRSSVSPTAAATPSTRSNRPENSGSSPGDRILRPS